MQKSRKRRSFSRLDIKERIIIETRWCIDKKSVSAIAKELNRHRSTVYREIDGRPRIGAGRYKAYSEQRKYLDRKHNQGRKSVFVYKPLKEYVINKLKLGWSPEQIDIRLPIEYVNDKKMRVSYETIYVFIYKQIRSDGKVEFGGIDLRGYLPLRRRRRMKPGFRKAKKLERIGSLPSIEKRPKLVEKRKEVGHWEGDTMVSRKSSVRVKSVNELVSGIVLFKKTKAGTAVSCDEALVKRLSQIPKTYLKTLTQDRGTENLNYRQVEEELGIKCYFAHPYCSHERGANENANGLFRRRFHKGLDFAKIKDQDIYQFERLLNSRPRKRLGGLTPYEVFYQMTGVALDS